VRGARPSREALRLLLGTNDARRRVGQALAHLHRSLVFWGGEGRSFAWIVRSWAVVAAAVFDDLATTLRELEVFGEDRRLRPWLAAVLLRLAADLEGGHARLFPFVRWLDARFPALTRMMRAEPPGSRVYDLELARALTTGLVRVAGDASGALVDGLREAAASLHGAVTPADGAWPPRTRP